MLRYFILSITLTCLFIACRKDDTGILDTCPGNDTYSLDLTFPSPFIGYWVWLTNEEGRLSYQDDKFNPPATGSLFFNFHDACESSYTLSAAIYSTASGGFGNFSPTTIEQYAQVPSGKGLSLLNVSFSSGNVIFEHEIIIEDCPPIDSVRLGFGQESVLEEGFYRMHYDSDQRIMTLYIADRYAATEDIWLAFRTAEEQSWRGEILTMSPFGIYNELHTLNDFPTIGMKSTTIQSEEPLTGVEIHLVTDEENNRTALIGSFSGSQISLPVPNEEYPLVIRTISGDDEKSYEVQRSYANWPEQIVHPTSTLSLDEVTFSYPQLNFSAEGADIIYLKSGRQSQLRRSFIGPALAGANNIRLPNISTFLSGSGAELNQQYSTAFDGGSMQLIHYPLLDGNYTDYLTKTIGSPTSRDPRLLLEYEKICINF